VKPRGPRQTICDEPGGSPRNPYCGGKLKSVTTLDPEAALEAGKGQEVFRCQICGTLYSEVSPYAPAGR
jgi:hypothetical protein